MVSEVVRLKPGRVEMRDAWSSIAEALLKIQSEFLKIKTFVLTVGNLRIRPIHPVHII